MRFHAPIVVIGDGVVGCNVLYHLTKFNRKYIVLVELSPLERVRPRAPVLTSRTQRWRHQLNPQFRQVCGDEARRRELAKCLAHQHLPRVGQVTLSPTLNETGMLIGDLTVSSLSDDHFQIIGA